MQGRKLFSLSTLMILLALCFISVPGVAGDHPWDIDNGDENKDIREVDLPDGTDAKSFLELGSTDGASGFSTSLSAMPPVVQLAFDYIFRSWFTHSKVEVDQSTVVQSREMKRSKRRFR